MNYAEEMRQAAEILRKYHNGKITDELTVEAVANVLDSLADISDGGGKYPENSTEYKALMAMDAFEPNPESLMGRGHTLAWLVTSGILGTR